MNLLTHFPIVQILIFFFGAITSAISFNRSISWFIATICAFFSLILAIYVANQNGIFQNEIFLFSYHLGGWQAPIGIEYKIDRLNQPIIIFINFILLCFLLFGKELINLTIINYIQEKYQHIFYSLLLFAHTGYLGVISTNDLFNIYVFIEISSLAIYVLMAQGSNQKALIGALDYLIIGTIGATLILIGIGFLLAVTGSLNITDIASILARQPLSRLTIAAIGFFLTGIMLKMAFFPMYFWMLSSYNAVAPIILTYISGISGIFGCYIILRFIEFTIGNEIITSIIMSIINPLSIVTIVVCTFFAFRANELKKIIIYSSLSQTGYVFLLMSIAPCDKHLLFKLLLLDSINKMALFTIIAHLEYSKYRLKSNEINQINADPFPYKTLIFKILAAFGLIFSAGLPITATFLLKLEIFDLLITNRLLITAGIVLFVSLMALLYHLNIMKFLFFSSDIQINTKLYGLIIIIIIQIFMLFYANNFTSMLII